MTKKNRPIYRAVPRQPVTHELILEAIADVQKLIDNGRVTNQDLKNWEAKYLRFIPVE